MRFNSKKFKKVFTPMHYIWKLLVCVCVCVFVCVCVCARVCCYCEAPVCKCSAGRNLFLFHYPSIIMVLFSNALKLELYKIFQCKLSMISLLKAVSVYSVKRGYYTIFPKLSFFLTCHNFFPLSSVQIIIILACCLLCVL